MSNPALYELDAASAAAAIRAGRITATELVRACLERTAELEGSVGAWAYLDPDHALAQARAADLAHAEGRPQGPLHGVPVGIKDIFDTWDMPTENGSPIHAGRRPGHDAAAVARLRAAGAVIMGKTVTTEFATFHPGKTRNPHDPSRTPGGSSSGSAAAVAAFMVPLAIGSQTVGSVIRPAAYCGVVGYKPSFGLASRAGSFRLSRRLDHVGAFARSVEDAALLADVLIGHDASDPDTRATPSPRLFEICREAPPVPPRFAFVRTPAWRHIEPDGAAAFEEFANALARHAEEAPFPPGYDDTYERHTTILCADLAVNLAREYRAAAPRLSPRLRSMIERGRLVSAVDYLGALDHAERLGRATEELFESANVLLMPAAPGSAPDAAGTGSPVFCSLATLCGLPAVTLPLLTDSTGLPMGVQLVGMRGDDGRLLRAARWLAAELATPARAAHKKPRKAKTKAKTKTKKPARR